MSRAPLDPPAGYAVAAIVLVFFPLFADGWWTLQVGVSALAWGVVASSFAFLARFGAMISFAPIAIAACASQAFARVAGPLDTAGVAPFVLLGIVAGLITAAVLGAISGLVFVRVAARRASVATLALALAAYFAATDTGTAVLARLPLPGPDAAAPAYYLCLAVAAGCWFALRRVADSGLGLGLRAIAANAVRARAAGVEVDAHRIIANIIAGLIAGAGGMLMVIPVEGSLLDDRVASTPLVALALAPLMAVAGGLRSPSGPYLGALAVVLVDLVGRAAASSDVGIALVGIGALAVAYASRDGLVGLWRRWTAGVEAAPEERAPEPHRAEREDAR